MGDGVKTWGCGGGGGKETGGGGNYYCFLFI